MTYTDMVDTLPFKYGFLKSATGRAVELLKSGDTNRAYTLLVNSLGFVCNENEVCEAIELVSRELSKLG
jgi:hypothetical protein